MPDVTQEGTGSPSAQLTYLCVRESQGRRVGRSPDAGRVRGELDGGKPSTCSTSESCALKDLCVKGWASSFKNKEPLTPCDTTRYLLMALTGQISLNLFCLLILTIAGLLDVFDRISVKLILFRPRSTCSRWMGLISLPPKTSLTLRKPKKSTQQTALKHRHSNSEERTCRAPLTSLPNISSVMGLRLSGMRDLRLPFSATFTTKESAGEGKPKSLCLYEMADVIDAIVAGALPFLCWLATKAATTSSGAGRHGGPSEWRSQYSRNSVHAFS